MKRTSQMTPWLLLIFAACATETNAEPDPCAEAADHLAACFPDETIAAPDSCDPAVAAQLAAQPCSALEPGKEDWFCSWWTPFLCGIGDDVLASHQRHPNHLAVTDTHVYWLADGDVQYGHDVMRAALDGSGVERVDASPSPKWELTAHGASVYWVARLAGGASELYTLRDGAPELLLAAPGEMHALTATDAHVYWADRRYYGPTTEHGDFGLHRFTLATRATERLGPADAELRAGSLVASAEAVFFSGATYAADETPTPGIFRVSLTTGALELVAAGAVGGALASCGDALCFELEGAIQRLDPVTETTPTPVYAMPEALVIGDLDADAAHVYFVDFHGESVDRIDIATGARSSVASFQDKPRSVALSAGRVLWANDGTYLTFTPGPGDYMEDGSVRAADMD